jgi:hypothetical protein
MATKTILEFCLSPALGGLELCVKDSFEYFKAKTRCYICVAPQKSLDNAIDDKNKINIKRNKLLPIFPALKLAKFIDEKDIDIVHFHWTRDIAFADMPSGQYDIPAIQGLYDVLYAKGIDSQKDALEVGCMVEVTDINDLDRYITMAEESNATDVVDAFTVLRNGSYSHYWGFDKGLKNLDIADGCCSLGVVDGVDYCHSDYPQEEHGDGNGQESSNSEHGQGNGQGHRH